MRCPAWPSPLPLLPPPPESNGATGGDSFTLCKGLLAPPSELPLPPPPAPLPILPPLPPPLPSLGSPLTPPSAKSLCGLPGPVWASEDPSVSLFFTMLPETLAPLGRLLGHMKIRTSCVLPSMTPTRLL